LIIPDIAKTSSNNSLLLSVITFVIIIFSDHKAAVFLQVMARIGADKEIIYLYISVFKYYIYLRNFTFLLA